MKRRRVEPPAPIGDCIDDQFDQLLSLIVIDYLVATGRVGNDTEIGEVLYDVESDRVSVVVDGVWCDFDVKEFLARDASVN